MSTESNKALIREYMEEVWNRRDPAAADRLFAPSYVNHDPDTPGGPFRGPDGIRQIVQTYTAPFPDLHYTIENQVAEGDWVATRWVARGTHTAPFMGFPATGKSCAVTGTTLERVENGKIMETYANVDLLGLMMQLGMIPIPK